MKGEIEMSGLSMIILGLLAVIILAVFFFGAVAHKGWFDSAKSDSLFCLDEFEKADNAEKFLNKNNFYQIYQPILDAKTEKIIGCEALTRLKDEHQNDIMPETFLKKVKSDMLSDVFDMYVLKKCCEWAKQREDKVIAVTCNFSRWTLAGKDAAEKIIRIAEQTGVSPKLIAIEVTEDSAAASGSELKTNIEMLKKAGFGIYLDDFGKAYTSLDDITKFCPDVIKIDKNILYSINEKHGQAIFNNIIRLAHDIGANVLCEGIETKQQADSAKKAGCDLLQGFYFHKPMTSDRLDEIL